MWGDGKVAFGEKLIGWIKWFISTTSFSVLLNGAQIGYFGISKGWQGGPPLSPYLFEIVIETFNILIERWQWRAVT